MEPVLRRVNHQKERIMSVADWKETTQEKLAADLKAVVTSAEDLLKVTADQAGEGYATARKKVERSLRAAKEELEDVGDTVTKETRHAAKVTDRYVHDNPWQAIGTAAAVGVIVGMLIRRH
jgi:ElaB/YqjD/DUF883 family membrane-anchored ribosome-binding protein